MRKRWASTPPRQRQSGPGTARWEQVTISAVGRGRGEPVHWAPVLMKGPGEPRPQALARTSIRALDRRAVRRRTRAGQPHRLLKAAMDQADSPIHPAGFRNKIGSRDKPTCRLRPTAFRPARSTTTRVASTPAATRLATTEAADQANSAPRYCGASVPSSRPATRRRSGRPFRTRPHLQGVSPTAACSS
jgi:hypothetical protein